MGNSNGSWAMRATPRRWAGTHTGRSPEPPLTMHRKPTCTLPWSGAIRPATTPSTVDFPTP
ncbi:hypothetical protein, partial [Kocuria tytonicola]|uniref:hypothetical protein n=1 Tax=Kocuria tytonicola TaxID=2055946 RepID=UPI001F0CBD4E